MQRDESGIPREVRLADVVELREVDKPAIEDHQVLVRVHASSVNPAEWYTVNGPWFVRLFGSGIRRPVEELGFDGVDAGGLDESWRQQPGTPVYTKDFDADGVRRGLYEASKDRAIEWRGTSNSPGTFTAPA